jgi:translocation and assembly module TamB
MKRWLLIGTCLSVLILALLSWGVYRLLWTPGGVHWLLEKIPQYTSLTIRAEKVAGRIAGDLLLEGVQVRWEGGKLEIQQLRTSFRISHLLRGRILFEKIAASRISFEEKPTPPEPLDLTLPRVSGLLGRLDLEVRTFLLEAIRYQSGEEPPLVIKKIGGRLAWKQGTLAVNPLEMELTAGRLKGALGLGLAVPSLGLDIQFYPEKPLWGSDRIFLQARLKEGRRPEQLAGPLAIQGRSGTGERILFQSDLAVAQRRITLHRVSFREKGREGTVHGQGAIIFEQADTAYLADLKLDGLDLSREVNFPARVSGFLRVAGNPTSYSGAFDFKNNVKTWQNLQLRGGFQGTTAGLEVRVDRGEWIKGYLQGRVSLAWEKYFSIQTTLEGRQFKPEQINAGWPGIINVDLKGNLLWSEAGLSGGTLDIRLLESRFQGKNLQGGIMAALKGESLSIEKAELRGRGFALAARGALADRLNFEARVADLSALLPESRGGGVASGWVRWRNQKLAGRLSLQGKHFSWNTITAETFNLEGGLNQEKSEPSVDLTARIGKGTFNFFPVDSLSLKVQGTMARQGVNLSLQTPEGKVQAGLEGAYRQSRWEGTLMALAGEIPRGKAFRLRDPAVLNIGPERIRLSPLVLTGAGGEVLTLEGDLDLKPLSGFVRGEWQRIDLARARFWLKQLQPEGEASGRVQARFSGEDRLEVNLRNELKGKIRIGQQTVELNRGDLNLTWNDAGLRSSWDLSGLGGVRLWGEAASPEKGRFSFPEKGSLKAQWNGLRLDLLKPWLPEGLDLQGQLTGQVQGFWTKGLRFNLDGGVNVQGGSLAWKENGSELRAQVRRADLRVRWVEEALNGDLAVELDGYGKASGKFNLPLPARFPLKLNPSGPLQAGLSGNLRESGLVTALFPQAVRSSRGKLQWDLSATGTWEKPTLRGNLELAEGGADLPSLGLRLQDVALKGTLGNDRLQIDSLDLRSGPGTLNGKAVFRLKDWKITELHGRLLGKNFQFINRPNFQALSSPEVTFNGTPDRIQVKGKIEIPEALITKDPIPGIKKASPDVVIVDAPPSPPAGRVYPIQGLIHLVFGEKVRVKVGGLDTLLKGNIRVAFQNSKDLTADGEIRADQGTYLVQGTKLNITRGRVMFQGPPDNPGLDILAVRTIRGSQRLEDYVDEVKAGVVVTGSIRSPLVRLYSQPSMSETDVLSYILFGKPMGRGADQQNLAILGKAAQLLLGDKMDSSLVSRLKLDTLDIQSEGGDVSQSIVTVGKYLDPRLYLGLGGSLFSNTYQVILRYALTPRLELETRGGTQSGGGIYYKVEFE